NHNGTFFGSRFSGGSVTGPGARSETAAYAALALALRMHRTTPRLLSAAPMEAAERSLEGSWLSPTAEAGAARGPRLFASFAWRSVGGGEGLTGLFVPPGGDDLVGW